jgi:lipopolysaccharide transport system permease protein
MPHPDPTPQRLVLQANSGLRAIDFREVLNRLDLLWFLAVRDTKVRYSQTMVGVGWAVLQPLTKMAIFTVIFGMLAKISTASIPYPVFALCGLLPWQLFAHSLAHASNSLVDNERLITKIYFPRLLLPLSSVISGLLDFAISMVLLVALMLFYRITPTPAVLLLPVFVAMAVLTALAVGLWLSALTAIYRDFRYTLVFLTEIWFFLTPVAYPGTLIPEKWRWFYGLNPMAGVVEGFRWAMLGEAAPSVPMLGVSAATILLLLAGGMIYFKRIERTIADVV